MNVLNPPTPSVPKPKSGLPPQPKSGKPPKPPSPFSNPPIKPAFKPPFPANPFKPVLQSGRLPGALPNIFGKQPTGPLTRAAAKAVPAPKPLVQQIADFEKQQMVSIKRVEAAEKADKRAQISRRRGLS